MNRFRARALRRIPREPRSDAPGGAQHDPTEIEVQTLFKARADDYARKLKDVPTALVKDRAEAQLRSRELRTAHAPLREIQAADKALNMAIADRPKPPPSTTKWAPVKARCSAPMTRPPGRRARWRPSVPTAPGPPGPCALGPVFRARSG